MRLDLKNSTPKVSLSAQTLRTPRPKHHRSRELFIFLIFVLLSATFWFVQSLQRRFTYTHRIPVVYDSVPPEVGLPTTLPKYIEVNLEDEGAHFLEYTTRGLAPIRLRLQRDGHVIAGFSISSSLLSGEVRSRLSTGARVISIAPSSIEALAYRRQRKVVPITWGSRPRIAMGYATGDIELTPAEVTVFASAKVLDTLTHIQTAPFEENVLQATTTTKVRLRLPEGVYASTNVVQVHIPIEQLTEQSFTLPVEVTGAPEGFVLLPLPRMVTIQLTLPRSRYKDIHPEDLKVAVAYPDLVTEAASVDTETPRQLPLTLVQKPDWLKHYRLTPDHVQYVIEERK